MAVAVANPDAEGRSDLGIVHVVFVSRHTSVALATLFRDDVCQGGDVAGDHLDLLFALRTDSAEIDGRRAVTLHAPAAGDHSEDAARDFIPN